MVDPTPGIGIPSLSFFSNSDCYSDKHFRAAGNQLQGPTVGWEMDAFGDFTFVMHTLIFFSVEFDEFLRQARTSN